MASCKLAGAAKILCSPEERELETQRIRMLTTATECSSGTEIALTSEKDGPLVMSLVPLLT